jgi:preprotein translocase subunit SecA
MIRRFWNKSFQQNSAWDDSEMLRAINRLAPVLEKSPAGELRSLSQRLMDDVRRRQPPLGEYVVEGFALVREVARREVNLFPYDVQILGGLALCRGTVVEMATGEGKTLVQSLPAYCFALAGRGVHVVTSNAYLAERDQRFSEGIFEFLGITSASLPERVPPLQKQKAYAADVTFGTGTEFGFDYLRDQLLLFGQPSTRLGEKFARTVLRELPPDLPLAQRGLVYAIIDEADSILIDEAMTPLVIGGKGNEAEGCAGVYLAAQKAAGILEESVDYRVDGAYKTVRLTEGGVGRLRSGEVEVPWASLGRPWERYVENALRAVIFMKKDVHYIVSEGKIVIVDQFTGRTRPDSTWREGLHQAVEVKEGVEVNPENDTLASVSRQSFFLRYEKLCGMTGTAMESAAEFAAVYQLPVQPIARNKPLMAVELPERIFVDKESRMEAIVEEIARRHRTGQPVLIGSGTIGNSEALAALLDERGIGYELLNAKQDAEEAGIVAKAGKKNAVTIATNMAGRGTDIPLGSGVKELGGLHVIGLELEESRRIDRQLGGRSGRQGDPGSSQWFLSADDQVIRVYNPDAARRLAGSPADENGEVTPAAWPTVFRKAQQRAERQHLEGRKSVMQRDKWLADTKMRLA